ncbi:hypothetical protein ABZY57_18535 [Streptomyces sp. NPDC006450]|uniref:hypothetical protein n=1 Tax=Streptomyces sp. NPDC006450 TaxID=3155458 RepID=UPI0033A55737
MGDHWAARRREGLADVEAEAEGVGVELELELVPVVVMDRPTPRSPAWHPLDELSADPAL